MNSILAAAIILTMSTSVWLVLRWGHLRCEGTEPLPLFTFLAILFTSGLDVGLIMFPLVDFQTYEAGADYGFSNPLAIEFGFWGFLVWGFYFLTTFYFCIVEPRLKLFELPWIKQINNGVIIWYLRLYRVSVSGLPARLYRGNLRTRPIWPCCDGGVTGGYLQHPPAVY